MADSGKQRGGPAGGAAVVDLAHVVTDEGSGATFEVKDGEAILDAALRQGVELAHGCRHGVCGACAIEVVEGVADLVAADPIERNSLDRFRLPGSVRLACRACVRGSVTIRPK